MNMRGTSPGGRCDNSGQRWLTQAWFIHHSCHGLFLPEHERYHWLPLIWCRRCCQLWGEEGHHRHHHSCLCGTPFLSSPPSPSTYPLPLHPPAPPPPRRLIIHPLRAPPNPPPPNYNSSFHSLIPSPFLCPLPPSYYLPSSSSSSAEYKYGKEDFWIDPGTPPTRTFC